MLVHELGHSLVAGARGIRVDSITLFIFGGVSNITKEASTARDEFLIAVVGPVTSLVLAGLFWAIGQVLPAGTALVRGRNLLATYTARRLGVIEKRLRRKLRRNTCSTRCA